MIEEPVIRFIQLSDTHLFADQYKSLLGVNTYDSFMAVVQLLEQERGKINFIIHSGDIAQDQSPEAYLHLSTALDSFNVPVYWIPGNHDDLNILEHVFPHGRMVNDKDILLNHWQLILLNTQKKGAVEGYLETKELARLQYCLQQHQTHHAIILFHHQPVAVGCGWLDKLGLHNASEFWELVEHFPQIKYVLFGHVHQEFISQVGNIHCLSTPSTCIQFHRKKDDFKLEKLAPGYRWVELYADGRLETGICRTSSYIGEFDQNATGY